MKKFYVQDKEAGNYIDVFETKEEAEKAILEYEEADKKEGCYEENFYEVADENHCPI